MKKSLLSLSLLGVCIFTNAQVGIGTNTPNATLDVVGVAADATKLDGVIPPRITGDQLKAKTYTLTQDGTIVYVTDAAISANQTGQTINVNMPGLYYFDGKSTLTWVYLGSNPVMSNFRSNTAQILTTNVNTDQLITFTAIEALINTATDFNDSNDTFTIKNDGYYQLSAFIGFNANRPDFTAATQFVAVNLKLKVNGADATGIRSVFAGITAGTGTAIQIPSTILKLNKGDIITFYIQRPALTIGLNSNQDFGSFVAPNGHINLPTGQSYTKSLTILKIK